MISDKQLYSWEGYKVKRYFPLEKIKALTISTTNKNSFIVHVKEEYDYVYDTPKRAELFEQIAKCYFNIVKVKLPIYGVPNMSMWVTSKSDVAKKI